MVPYSLTHIFGAPLLRHVCGLSGDLDRNYGAEPQEQQARKVQREVAWSILAPALGVQNGNPG